MKRNVWGKWVLGHALGATAGTGVVLLPAVLMFLLSPWQERVESNLLGMVTMGVTGLMWLGVPWLGAAVGLGIGLYEVWALKKLGAAIRTAAWLAFTMVGGLLPGWLLVFAVVMAGSNGGNTPTDVTEYVVGVVFSGGLFAGLPGLVCGAGVGALQAFLLRRNWPAFPRYFGWFWLTATALGWGGSWAWQGAAAGLMITSAVRDTVNMGQLLTGLVALMTAWAFHGLLTGLVLTLAGRKPGRIPVPAGSSPP